MARRQSQKVSRKRGLSRRAKDQLAEAAPVAEGVSHPLLDLQRQVGNAEVARMLARRRMDDDGGLATGAPPPNRDVSAEKPERRDSESDQDGAGRARSSRNGITTGNGGAGNGAAAALQRALTRPLKNGSISLDAKAQLFVHGNQLIDTVSFPDNVQEVSFQKSAQVQGDQASDHGTVRFIVNGKWDFTGTDAFASENKGDGLLVVDVPFRIIGKPKGDDDSLIKFKQPRLAQQESNGAGAALDPQAQAIADSDETGGSVTVSPRITYQEQTATQLGITPPTPLGIGGQSQTQTTETEAFGGSFTVDLPVSKAPAPQPQPQPGPNKPDGKQKVLKRFAMTTEFGVNQRVPPPNDVALLKMWWNGQAGLTPLPTQQARDAVRSGQTDVFVIGHASKTGSREYNLVLSKDRADNITKIVAADDVMGAGAKINTSGAGLDDAKAAGEAQTERFVVVVFEALVDEDDSPKAAGEAAGASGSSAADQSAGDAGA